MCNILILGKSLSVEESIKACPWIINHLQLKLNIKSMSKFERKGKPYDTTADSNDQKQDTGEHHHQVSSLLLLDCLA